MLDFCTGERTKASIYGAVASVSIHCKALAVEVGVKENAVAHLIDFCATERMISQFKLFIFIPPG